MNYSEKINEMAQCILEYIKKSIDTRSYSDKTFKAKITMVVSEDKYKVLYCGNTYTVSSSILCEVGDTVRVCAPCNNWQELYIVENRTKGKTLRDIQKSITTINDSLYEINNNILNDIYVGSITLYSEPVILTDTERHNLIGAYYETLISCIFDNITIPEGYKKSYRLSAILTTSNNNHAIVGFNGQPLLNSGTYSESNFRISVMSEKFYGWTDFPTELCLGYNANGLNLYVQNIEPLDTNTEARIYNIQVHGYFERNN